MSSIGDGAFDGLTFQKYGFDVDATAVNLAGHTFEGSDGTLAMVNTGIDVFINAIVSIIAYIFQLIKTILDIFTTLV